MLGKKVIYKGTLAIVIQDNGHCKIEAYHNDKLLNNNGTLVKTMYVQKADLLDYKNIHRDMMIQQICNE